MSDVSYLVAMYPRPGHPGAYAGGIKWFKTRLMPRFKPGVIILTQPVDVDGHVWDGQAPLWAVFPTDQFAQILVYES